MLGLESLPFFVSGCFVVAVVVQLIGERMSQCFLDWRWIGSLEMDFEVDVDLF
jgi:hypothetical protein